MISGRIKINRNELDKIKIEWYNKTAVCVVIASGGYPGEYKKGLEISGLDEAGKIDKITVFHAGTGSKDSKIVTTGGRVLGVTGVESGIKDAIRTVYKAVDKICFEAMHFRRDIGKKALKR
jgi:phosphoribosylamine--glycine ligase